jgi:hypothetical protein
MRSSWKAPPVTWVLGRVRLLYHSMSRIQALGLALSGALSGLTGLTRTHLTSTLTQMPTWPSFVLAAPRWGRLHSLLTTPNALRIDSSGNLIQTVNTTAATLTTNQTLTFSIVDNSTLRISVRGSDGTTRTATVALT